MPIAVTHQELLVIFKTTVAHEYTQVNAQVTKRISSSTNDRTLKSDNAHDYLNVDASPGGNTHDDSIIDATFFDDERHCDMVKNVTKFSQSPKADYKNIYDHAYELKNP